MSPIRTVICSALLIAASLTLATGCVDKGKPYLDRGFTQLSAGNHSSAESEANKYLTQKGAAPAKAEALYLRGRSYEQRPAPSPAAGVANFERARADYVKGLSYKPAGKIDTYLRTSLANVAFFLDDYATSLRELQHVEKRDSDPASRVWNVYRTALCYQRMGQFARADAEFDRVIKSYPGTVQAKRSAEQRGARGFYVQLGSYGSASSANSVIGQVRTYGVQPLTSRAPNGTTRVMIGPFSEYVAAKQGRARWLGAYPDALIVP